MGSAESGMANDFDHLSGKNTAQERAVIQGRMTYHNGGSPKDNPYCRRVELRTMAAFWDMGYNNAVRNNEKKGSIHVWDYALR